MRIRELILSNFRGFREAKHVPFNDQFTVIAGVNGRGKTAILDALSFLLQRLLPQIADARQEYRYLQPSDIHRGPKGDIPPWKTCLEASFNCAGIPISSFAVEYGSKRIRDPFTLLAPAVKERIRNAYGPDSSRSNDAAPLAVYYTTDRAAYRLPQSEPVRVMPAQAAAFRGALVNRTVDYKDFVSRFRVMRAGADGQREENPHHIGDRAARSIQRAIKVFLEEFSNLQIPDGRPNLQIEKLGVPLTLAQLSDGERSFVAIVADLCRRLALANRELEEPLHGAGMVLIDELELHLHPKWQRRVVQQLRETFPNVQFIATTHSPFVIQSLRPHELFSLDPKEFPPEYADKSIEDIAEGVMGVQMPQKSERYLEMIKTAERYFRLLKKSQPQSAGEADALRQELDALTERFSDDPAYVALLRVERETTLRA